MRNQNLEKQSLEYRKINNLKLFVVLLLYLGILHLVNLIRVSKFLFRIQFLFDFLIFVTC